MLAWLLDLPAILLVFMAQKEKYIISMHNNPDNIINR